MKNGPLHHDALWISLGQSSYLGCQWLLVFAFAKLGGPDAVGIYAFGLAVSAPVIILANMHLRELHASDSRGEYLLRERLALRVAGLVVGLVVIAVLCWLMPWDAALATVVLAVGCAKALESLIELGYGAMQARQRFGVLATAQISRGLVGLGCGVASFVLTQQVLAAVLGVIGGWLSIFILHDLRALRRMLPEPDGLLPRCSRTRLWALFRQAAPMGITGGLNTITLMTSSYVIQFYHDKAQLGFYVTVGYLLLPINIMILALGQAALPRMASAYHAGDASTVMRLVLTISGFVLVVGISAILLCYLMGGPVLAAIYGPEWGDLSSLLVYLAIAGVFQWLATACGFAVTAMRQLNHQLSIAMITCVVSIVSGFALIPAHGLIGAAWSAILTGITLLGGYLVLFGSSYRKLRSVIP